MAAPQAWLWMSYLGCHGNAREDAQERWDSTEPLWEEVPPTREKQRVWQRDRRAKSRAGVGERGRSSLGGAGARECHEATTDASFSLGHFKK